MAYKSIEPLFALPPSYFPLATRTIASGFFRTEEAVDRWCRRSQDRVELSDQGI